MGRGAAHVFHQLFQLVFGAVRGEVGDLRLEGDHQVGGGVDDGGAEVVDLAGVTLQAGRETRGFGVQPHAQHGAVAPLRLLQHLDEGHETLLY